VPRERKDPTVTIPEIARSMGVELKNEDAWAIGSAMARTYQQENGTEVPKALRSKTRGHGSHCFAVYPLSYVPRIRAAIEAAGAEKDRQGSFF
jgi:hypothetical protein